MARADIVGECHSILYGSHFGEKPAMRRGAASAAVTVSGSTAVFTLLAGEGASCRAGDVLAAYSPSDKTKCYVFLVISIATDTVTCYNGYQGAPAIANASADLNSAILEQNPTVTMYEMQKKVETIFAGHLFSAGVFKWNTYAITPNLATGQVALNAAVKEIIACHQLVGGAAVPVPCAIQRRLHTTLSATAVLGEFDFYDASTCYLATREKLDEDDSTHDAAVTAIAGMGAAALCLGASISERSMEPSNKDNQAEGQRADPASLLWRDFLTMRDEYARDLGDEYAQEISVQR